VLPCADAAPKEKPGNNKKGAAMTIVVKLETQSEALVQAAKLIGKRQNVGAIEGKADDGQKCFSFDGADSDARVTRFESALEKTASRASGIKFHTSTAIVGP
jgi:hypothetical protein